MGWSNFFVIVDVCWFGSMLAPNNLCERFVALYPRSVLICKLTKLGVFQNLDLKYKFVLGSDFTFGWRGISSEDLLPDQTHQPNATHKVSHELWKF